MVVVFTTLLTTMWDFAQGALNIVTGSIDILILPFTAVRDAWILMNSAYVGIFGTSDIGQLVSALVIIVFSMATLTALMDSDWEFFNSMGRGMVNIGIFIVDWSLRLIGWVIRVFTSLIPGLG